jgi:hypothetical protein
VQWILHQIDLLGEVAEKKKRFDFGSRFVRYRGYVSCEVLTAVLLKIQFLWGVTPSWLVNSEPCFEAMTFVECLTVNLHLRSLNKL